MAEDGGMAEQDILEAHDIAIIRGDWDAAVHLERLLRNPNGPEAVAARSGDDAALGRATGRER